MKWKCTNCGNKVSSNNPPRKCPISCCEQVGTYVEDTSPPDLLLAKWKCTNCGNRTSQAIAPSTCPITCCNASNSYILINP